MKQPIKPMENPLKNLTVFQVSTLQKAVQKNFMVRRSSDGAILEDYKTFYYD